MAVHNKQDIWMPLTIKEQVYGIIKKDILNGIIKPGGWLQENELAAKLKVSRSPVREALKELVGEGLLENIPNKGVFVRKLTEEDIIDIFEMRIVIEKYSIEKVVERITEEDVEELRGILVRLEEAFDSGDVNLYCNIDAELHNAIIHMSKNKLVYEVNQKGFYLLQPFRVMSLNSEKRFKESIDEHRDMVEAIIDKDAENAWKCDLNHLNRAKDEILSYMANNRLKMDKR